MFIVVGALSIVVAAAGYLSPRVRNVEDELPDVMPDQETAGEPEPIPASGDSLESEPVLGQAD
jgi:hypothetical protein